MKTTPAEHVLSGAYELLSQQHIEPKAHLHHILHAAERIREQYEGLLGVLLIEHAATVLDEPPLKTRKGGITPLMQSHSATRLLRGATYEMLIQAIQEEQPLSQFIGLDPELSKKGQKQAQRLGKLMQELRTAGRIATPHVDEDYTPYTSRLTRTIQTAGMSGLGWNTHELQEFDEKLMLTTHGLTTAQIIERYPEFEAAFRDGQELVHERIEPSDHFAYRCESGLLQVLLEAAAQRGVDGRWIPIVTHQSNIKVILAKLLGNTIDPWTITVENTSVHALLIREKQVSDPQRPRPRWPQMELDQLTSPELADDHTTPLRTEHSPDGWNHISPLHTYEGCVVAQNYIGHLPDTLKGH